MKRLDALVMRKDLPQMAMLHPAEPVDLCMSGSRLDKVSELVASWIEPGLHQAIVALVARRGSVVMNKAYGSLTPEGPDVTLDTVFPVASNSKVITATAVMLLVERGLVSLNTPISDFFPEFTGKHKNDVRLWHLLTHSSGGLRMEEMDAHLMGKMASGFEPPSCPKNRNPLIHAFLSAGLDAPLVNAPGTSVGYSNFGFEMLGDIVRQASGQPLGSFAEENIFEPLGMHDTHYGLATEQADRIVRRPLDAPGASVSDTWFFDGLEGKIIRENPWAYGSVVSTAADMGNFCQMFLNKGSYGGERILSPTTVAEMARNQTEGFIDLDREGTRSDAARGLGWDLPSRKNSLLYASLYSTQTFKHSGAGGAMVWIDPINELVGVFLSVELSIRSDGQRNWRGDHFANAVTASIVDT